MHSERWAGKASTNNFFLLDTQGGNDYGKAEVRAETDGVYLV